MKVCICTIAKQENKYVREFVEHYKNYGVDKIFLYDNNDQNDEKYEFILQDYIQNNFVEIINYRGKIKPQLQSYKNCYKNNYKKYNWLAFYDIDEFIYLKKFKNIKLFLNQKKFDKCQKIQLNWVFHTDNNLVYYDNRTLSERFPYRKKSEIGKKIGGGKAIKSIMRGNITTNISDVHYLSRQLLTCDGFGRIKESKIVTNISDLYYFYLDHFYCKSTEEFIEKIMKTDGVFNLTKHGQNLKLNVYFSINEITKEKLDFIEKKTKLNLSRFKKIKKIKY